MTSDVGCIHLPESLSGPVDDYVTTNSTVTKSQRPQAHQQHVQHARTRQSNGDSRNIAQQHRTTLGTASCIFNRLGNSREGAAVDNISFTATHMAPIHNNNGGEAVAETTGVHCVVELGNGPARTVPDAPCSTLVVTTCGAGDATLSTKSQKNCFVCNDIGRRRHATKLGAQVVRGPAWIWTNQDCGAGNTVKIA
jgi:hypothetical protein